MVAWSDGYWVSSDGLKLHYRHYAGGASRLPILCIPGLTRNARDFEGVAERLAGDWRLICVDLRGRGESAHAKDPMTYLPPTYLQDLEALEARLAHLVELKYFGGLTDQEIADALKLSFAQVRRDWDFARAWLRRRLEQRT